MNLVELLFLGQQGCLAPLPVLMLARLQLSSQIGHQLLLSNQLTAFLALQLQLFILGRQHLSQFMGFLLADGQFPLKTQQLLLFVTQPGLQLRRFLPGLRSALGATAGFGQLPFQSGHPLLLRVELQLQFGQFLLALSDQRL